jgi:hypothetical protein
VSEISRLCGGGDADRSLVPGSLRGYRTWRPTRRSEVVPEGLLPLAAVSRRKVLWPAVLSARCLPLELPRRPGGEAPEDLPPDSHRAPETGCDCGIYAWYAPDDTRMMHARVFGVVEASGLVLMGERGFRAEHARVVAVVTRSRRVAAACEAAGIVVYRRRRDLVRAYPPEDVSELIGPPEDEADADGEDFEFGLRRRAPGVDRTLVAAVWARTALMALAVAALPTVAGIVAAIIAEFALLALVTARLR